MMKFGNAFNLWKSSAKYITEMWALKEKKKDRLWRT